MTRRSALAALGAAVVALGAVSAYLLLPTAYKDGEGGALAAHNETGHSLVAVDPTGKTTSSWTFGLRLCLRETTPVTLEAVEPVTTVGQGFRLAGIGVRRFDAGEGHTPIFSVDGFPPPTAMVPDRIDPIPGFEVTTACGGAIGPRTELLVGLTREGDDGGGWQGLRVRYRVSGRPATVDVNQDFLICGASVSCD